MKEKIAKIIRTCTIAPIMAMVTLVIFYLTEPQIFGKMYNLAFALLFLTVLPVLAYPLQKYIPGYKDKGREGQRTLAMIFAVCGYVFGCLMTLCLNAPIEMWLIYLTYMMSGACVVLINKLFHFRASGHACGAAGPIALLVCLGVPVLIPGFILVGIVWWASLVLKRHTLPQLVGGTTIPLSAIVILNVLLR